MFLPSGGFVVFSPTVVFLANGLNIEGAALPALPLTLPTLLTLGTTLGFVVKRPATLGTWAILFLPSDDDGAEALKTWAMRFVDNDIVDEDVDETVDKDVVAAAAVAACSLSSFIFLKRSIIIIPGLSLAGGRAIGWLADGVGAWAIRCFFVGLFNIFPDILKLSVLTLLKVSLGFILKPKD